MNKLLIILLLGVSSVYADQQILMPNIESNGVMTKVIASATTSKSTNSTQLVGGWYPVFFNQFSDSKMQHIIMQIKQDRISKLIVSYDKNQALAKQIVTTIQATTDFNVQLEHVELVDDTAQYNHDQVVVTIYTKREN